MLEGNVDMVEASSSNSDAVLVSDVTVDQPESEEVNR